MKQMNQSMRPLNSFLQLHFFSLWEWEKKLRVEWKERALAALSVLRMKQSRRKVFELGGLVAAQPHGNQPMKKTSRLLQLIEQWSEESNPAQPQSNNPIKWIFSLLIHLMELLGGLNWFVCFSFGSWNEFIGGLWAAAAARQLAKKEESAERKTNEINEAISLWALFASSSLSGSPAINYEWSE